MSPQENNSEGNIICIILCAGEGTRIGKFIREIPKSLISISDNRNEPILYDTIRKLLLLNIKKIIVIAGYLKEKIQEFLTNLKLINPSLADVITFFDSDFEYLKGPLHSFLSITKNSQFYKENMKYILLPGDTVFEIDLLNILFSQISKLKQNNKPNLIISFRKIKVNTLKKRYSEILDKGFKFLISVARTKKTYQGHFLKQITQKDLNHIIKKKYLFQLIPCFIFDFNFVRKIKLISKENILGTLTEAINLLLKTKHKIELYQVSADLNFYDIDTYNDLQMLRRLKKKVDNSSSSSLRNFESK